MVIKNIEEEIKKLLAIKKIVDEITLLRELNPKLKIVSRLRYDFLKSKNLIKSEDQYYIADLSVKPYVEGFQG